MSDMIRFKFVYAGGLSAWMIGREGFSVGGFSHVAPMLPDGSHIDARSDVIKAPVDRKTGERAWPVAGFPPVIEPGVQHRPPNYERWKRWAVVALPCNAGRAKAAREYMRAKLGAAYDKDAIAGFVLGVSLHFPGRFICSAFGFDVARAAGFGHDGEVPDYEISPDEFYLLATNGWGGKIVASYGL